MISIYILDDGKLYIKMAVLNELKHTRIGIGPFLSICLINFIISIMC